MLQKINFCCLRFANFLALDYLTFISFISTFICSASVVSEEEVAIQFSTQKRDRDYLTCYKIDNVIDKLTLYY